MPSTHTSLHYHIVFSTKNRERWLTSDIRARVHDYLGGVVRGLGGMPHAIGGIDDHAHALFGLKPTHRLSDVMRELKSESSRWLHEELRLPAFQWQEGYGAFTFGAPDLETVRGYVLNQEQHHSRKTFQEEYVEMLKRGLVEYDDAYLW
ncbi:MAG: IS200/IS605 family transposase [Limisphaerales bacterium]